MKIAPVYAALERRGRVEQHLAHTGQHYDVLLNDVFFAELPLPVPDSSLHVGSGTHAQQTARALVGLEKLFLELSPELVVVPGDVNSTLAAGLAAAKLDIPVCHLEAGLRSFDSSMPEEHNRRVTDHLSSLLLTHSPDADENLAREGIPAERVRRVGNTMIDSLLSHVVAARARAHWRDYGLEQGRYLLVTLHRPALVDDPDLLRATMSELARVARELPVVFPAHPRTAQHLDGLGVGGDDRFLVLPPLPYTDFVSLELGAAAVLTDSGGVQEEATALGVRCFTMRENTERPVTVAEGTNRLLGLDPARIAEIPALLEERLDARVPALWDGRAGDRAAAEIERVVVGDVAEIGA